jgi:hypothetical protein
MGVKEKYLTGREKGCILPIAEIMPRRCPVTDETVQRAMLFDYYGELLTDKQREYYDLHYNEDLSLSEIAEQSGTSRQAVWDIIRRAEQTLIEYEEKTGLIRRSEERQRTVSEIAEKLSRITGEDNIKLCAEILAQLDSLD